MIVRALFWIAVVIVLMPGDSGFGRSQAAPQLVAGPVEMFRGFVRDHVARVRSEIAASEQARGEHIPHF